MVSLSVVGREVGRSGRESMRGSPGSTGPNPTDPREEGTSREVRKQVRMGNEGRTVTYRINLGDNRQLPS